MAFSPDGTLLATLGADGTARIWNLTTRQEAGAPMNVDRPAALTGAVAFSPSGRTLVTVGAGGRAQLWSVATHRALGKPMAAGPAATVVTFSPDGTKLVTAGSDGTARVWDVTFPADLPQAACGIADISLTRQQWADYAGSQPFRQVCPAG